MGSILVTGCFGMIGSRLCERLLEQKKRVIGIDILFGKKIKQHAFSDSIDNKLFKYYKASILNRKKLEKIVEKQRIEKIVHLAAKAIIGMGEEKPEEYFQVNVLGTLNMLELAKKAKAKQFVFSSSSNVYGLNKTPFTEEQAIKNPVSIYAITKRAGELLCQTYSKNYGINTTVLRLSTVYGGAGRKDIVVHKFVNKTLKGKKITIYGNGNTKRDYLYVEDAVNAFIRALAKPFKFEIFNIGSGKAISINKLVQLIEKKTGKKAIINKKKRKKSDLAITLSDISKAKKMLDWKPEIGIEKGIEKLI